MEEHFVATLWKTVFQMWYQTQRRYNALSKITQDSTSGTRNLGSGLVMCSFSPSSQNYSAPTRPGAGGVVVAKPVMAPTFLGYAVYWGDANINQIIRNGYIITKLSFRSKEEFYKHE